MGERKKWGIMGNEQPRYCTYLEQREPEKMAIPVVMNGEKFLPV